MQILSGLIHEISKYPPLRTQGFFHIGFITLGIMRQPEIIRFVGRKEEMLYATIGIQQILVHALQQFVGIRIGGANLVIGVWKFAQFGIFRMLEDEGDVSRSVEIRYQFDVIAQSVIGKFL